MPLFTITSEFMRIQLLSIFFIFLVLQSFSVYSQAPVITDGDYCKTGGGDFSVTPFEGCGTLTATIKNNLPSATSVGYNTNYDLKSQPNNLANVTSATYNAPGTYTILQVGSLQSTGFTLCKQVKVYENKAINAKLEVFCSILKVTIEDDIVAKAYNTVEINWGDGQNNSIWKSGDGPMTRSYSGAIPKISIQGKHGSNVPCAGETKFLDPVAVENSIESIQIKRLEMQSDGKITMLYNGMEKVSTEVFYSEANGNYLTTGEVRNVAQPGSIVLDKGLSAEKEYRLKLASEDNCGGKKDSREVKTMVLEATSQEGEIALKWNRYLEGNDFVGYQLFRDDVPIKSFPSIDDLTFSDTDIDCNKTYKYQIVASTSLVNSFSAPKSEKMLSTIPDRIKEASVTVADNNLITADVILGEKGVTNSYNLVIERAQHGSGNFTQVSTDQNQELHFEDNTVNTGSTSYCYRFKFENSCQLSTEFTEPVCSILLRQSPQELTWNDAVPFTEGLDSYDVIQSESGVLTPMGLNTTYPIDLTNQPKTEFSFQIRAKSKSGSLLSFSNLIKYEQNVMLLIPDAFTPNGDNVNERFEIKGLFINSFQISVFNRWGQVVFQSDDILQSWDGTINGANAPAGYYTYKTEISDIEDKPFVKEGTVLLIR